MAKAESVDPPNNNDHERTLRSTDINALAALTPFRGPDRSAQGRVRQPANRPFPAVNAKLPEPLGGFQPSSDDRTHGRSSRRCHVRDHDHASNQGRPFRS